LQREKQKKYYQKHKEAHKKLVKAWKKNNPDKKRQYDKKYKLSLKNRIKIREYKHKKWKTHLPTRIKNNVSQRIRRAIKSQNKVKSKQTKELLGCSIEFLKQQLESQFQPGMTWDNYGEWHIDHKIPCVAFDLSDLEQQKACFHYSNLQPLWFHDNVIKSDLLSNGQRARDGNINIIDLL
jgi:hypothetical protein